MKKLISLVGAIGLVVAGTSVASAHTVLIFSSPAKGAKIKVLPAKITLKFADPLLTLGTKAINKVVVSDPTNTVITSGKDVVHGAVLTDPLVDAKPVSGIYKVSYRVSAQDGHIVTGAFTFTLQN